MDRKSFFQTLGIGALGGISTWFGANKLSPSRQSGELCQSDVSDSNINLTPVTSPNASYNESLGVGGSLRATNSYGSMAHPPFFIKEEYTERFYFPPGHSNSKARLKEFSLNIFPLQIPIAHNVKYNAWTFDGIVPGPILRANLGDTLKVTVKNSSPEPHSLHFHGTHDPNEDGWEPIPAYGERIYTIEAGPIGLHPYHCHVPPLVVHTSKGLYGSLLVDPISKRPPAHEFILTFSSFDPTGRGKNLFYTWNGISGIYDRYPMKVPVGEKVRFYIQNLMEHESLLTFHLHAQTFDIFRSLGSLYPDGHSDVVSLGPTERVVLEFTLKKRGRYMFHPHQTHMAERGGMGWIVAI